MPIRTTVDIPELLHQVLRDRSHAMGVSMRSLIVRAIEQAYIESKKGRYLTGPIIKGTGKRGPLFPVDENPHDLILP